VATRRPDLPEFDEQRPPLFGVDITAGRQPTKKSRTPTHPLWTENKAKLIERYLYYFVLITKHGTYIDGFAGPQDVSKPDYWAARLVLENRPRWLRHFHLFDRDPAQVARLKDLRDAQAPPDRAKREPKRSIYIYQGDFNAEVQNLLNKYPIRPKEATFCLLDQRTFECRWATVNALAQHKSTGNKIELFYFLPIYWLGRALAAQKNTAVLHSWWGRADWQILRRLTPYERADVFMTRFKKELGYSSVLPYAIYSKKLGGRVMYYMIHATDHPDAPEAMQRAYRNAVRPKEPAEQLLIELAEAHRTS
jgi:three-Cys-motif partner protein